LRCVAVSLNATSRIHAGHRPQEPQLQRRTARAETWLYLEIPISVNCLCYHHRTTSVMFSKFASAAHLPLASFSYTCVLCFVLVLPLLLLPLLCFCRISSSCPFVLVSLILCLLLLCLLLLLLLLFFFLLILLLLLLLLLLVLLLILHPDVARHLQASISSLMSCVARSCSESYTRTDLCRNLPLLFCVQGQVCCCRISMPLLSMLGQRCLLQHDRVETPHISTLAWVCNCQRNVAMCLVLK
jgi:hypothetical protein